MALSNTACQIKWKQLLLSELGYTLKHILMNVDNQGLIFIGSNPVQEHIKQIDIQYHYICEYIKNEDITVFFIERKENPADMFPKNLPTTPFLELQESLGINFIKS